MTIFVKQFIEKHNRIYKRAFQTMYAGINIRLKSTPTFHMITYKSSPLLQHSRRQ